MPVIFITNVPRSEHTSRPRTRRQVRVRVAQRPTRFGRGTSRTGGDGMMGDVTTGVPPLGVGLGTGAGTGTGTGVGAGLGGGATGAGELAFKA